MVRATKLVNLIHDVAAVRLQHLHHHEKASLTFRFLRKDLQAELAVEWAEAHTQAASTLAEPVEHLNGDGQDFRCLPNSE